MIHIPQGGNVFRKIEQCVSIVAEYLGMGLLVLMTLVVCYTVFTRYVLGFTPAWGEETALLSMVWFGFLSIALGVRDDGHIGVTILDPLLSAPVLWVLNIFKYVMVIVFSGFMMFEGWKITKIGMLNQFPGLDISSAWLYGVVPFSGFAIFVYSLEKLLDVIRSGSRAAATGGADDSQH